MGASILVTCLVAVVGPAPLVRAASAPAIPWTSLGPRAIPNELASGPSGANLPTTGLAAAGEVTAVAVDVSAPATMWVGLGGGMWWGGGYSQGGVLGTVDGGATWRPLDQGLRAHSVAALWDDPSSPKVLVAATDGGLFRSSDAGAQWTLVATDAFRDLVASGGSLYAGGDAGVMVSRDGGASWRPVDGTTFVTALAASPTGVLAGEFDGTVLGVSGTRATVLAPAGPSGSGFSSLAVDPANPLVVYGSVVGTGSLARSGDGGRTWSAMPASAGLPASGALVRTVAVDPASPGVVDVGGDLVLYVSSDGGSTFATHYVGADIWNLVPDPAVPGSMLVLSDQGLYRVSDDGTTWVSLNGDLSSGLSYSVAVTGSTILARQQDFSLVESVDGGATWAMAPSAGGEDGDVVVDPNDPTHVYGLGTFDGLTVSDDGGRTWRVVDSVSAFAPGVETIAVAPTTPSTVYVASGTGVAVSRDAGATWSPTGWPFAHPYLVAVDPGDPSRIVVAASSLPFDETLGAASITSDGGSTWRALDLGGSPSAALFVGADLYLAVGGRILVSHDGGASVVDDSTGLASLPALLGAEAWPPVEALTAVATSSGEVLLASTTNGVFAQLAGSGPWVDVSGDLITRFVHQAVVAGASVYLATYGQGVVSTPLAGIVAALSSPLTVTTHPAPVTVSVRATTASGAPRATAVVGGRVVVVLTWRAGSPVTAGACGVGAHLVVVARRVSPVSVTCSLRVAAGARGAVTGWVSARAGATSVRRPWRLAVG